MPSNAPSDVIPQIPPDWLKPSAPPLEIDFGCHRGAFLLGMAALHPGVNFLGIEKQFDRVEKCNARILRLGLANALAVQGTGSTALEVLPEASVEVFHHSFPDPWPKRRHAARRVFQEGFVQAVRRILRPGGTLRLMTDNEPYFLEMQDLTRAGWTACAWDDGREHVETAFEKTFRRLGLAPFRLALRPSLPAGENKTLDF
jgi:tRNA (guanine-N7-)-methyltransferase